MGLTPVFFSFFFATISIHQDKKYHTELNSNYIWEDATFFFNEDRLINKKYNVRSVFFQ